VAEGTNRRNLRIVHGAAFVVAVVVAFAVVRTLEVHVGRLFGNK
jgi:hypothetical protein